MRKISGLIFTCLAVNAVIAQEASQLCSKAQLHKKPLAKIAVADPAEDNYDVKHVRINVQMNNSSAAISGDVLTTATVVVPAMSSYVFELNSQLVVDSVVINNQSLNVITNGHVRTVNLSAPFSQNTSFTAQVFYHGTINSSNPTGIRNQVSPTWNNMVTYTMSEPYNSKDWWPVKQSLTDKIDSADIWITVPANLKAGSNGVLQGITVMPNTDWRYEWKTKYPTDYYLISASVASYIDYSYYVHFPASNDSMLVQNYVYDNPQTLPFFKNRIDSVGLMIQYLSQLYGRYPFWQEKYGHCMVPLNGGMEHQTMTSLGNFGTTLSVHELAHQWFGDNVTCGSWEDIWLNEGFAAYTEYLFVEHFWPPSQAFLYMLDKHNNVLQDDTSGSVFVNDTTNESRIFDSRLTYDKGASIVHTLRFVFDNDSLFFQALKNYQTQYAGKTARITDFKNIAQQVLGQSLDTFFNQWIYGQGHPVYTAAWNQVGDWVFVKLDQTTTHSSVNVFATPVELQLYSSQGDTIVRVYHNQASQTYSFYWPKPMSSLFIDPNDWLLNEFGSISHDPTLNAATLNPAVINVYPNPAKTVWHVTGLDTQSELQLRDMNGKLLWKAVTDKNIDIPTDHLASGYYLLRISNKQKTSTIKLSKQ